MTYLRFTGLLVLTTVIGTLLLSRPVAADTDLPIGGVGQVYNTNGDGVRVRAQASVDSDTVKTLEDGWRVTVQAGPVSDEAGAAWYKISHTGAAGYILAEYLTTATGATGGLLVGESATVATDDGTALRLRDGVNGDVLLTMPHGAQVAVQGGPRTDEGNRRWFQIGYEGQVGWALGGYLRPAGGTVAAASRDTTSRAGSRPAPTTRSSGGGAALAESARQYVGHRYVFGGSSPAGFDCSGLVRYVALRTLGVDPGRDVFAQAAAGTPVAYGDLQPGDLVFFKNTYRWGLSHVGIYIGGGLMVNAQSESTGVRVQAINDGYWGARYHSARRLTN